MQKIKCDIQCTSIKDVVFVHMHDMYNAIVTVLQKRTWVHGKRCAGC